MLTLHLQSNLDDFERIREDLERQDGQHLGTMLACRDCYDTTYNLATSGQSTGCELPSELNAAGLLVSSVSTYEVVHCELDSLFWCDTLRKMIARSAIAQRLMKDENTYEQLRWQSTVESQKALVLVHFPHAVCDTRYSAPIALGVGTFSCTY